MINAALKVFALHRHACTDDIVKEAAISKGFAIPLFRKQTGCICIVYDYSVRYLLLELSTAVDAKRRICLLCYSRWNGKMHAILRLSLSAAFF